MSQLQDLLASYTSQSELSNLLESDKFKLYSVVSYGAKGDNSTNDYSSIYSLINTTINGSDAVVWFPTGVYKIGTSLTFPSNVQVVFSKGAMLDGVLGTETVTFNGNITAGPYQIFKTINVSGTPVIDKCYPEWFGAKGDGTTDDTTSISNLFSFLPSNSTVEFLDRTYLITSSISSTTAENIKVNFNKSTIKCNFTSSDSAFIFGVTNDTSTLDGIKITGGNFEISNPSSTLDVRYILIKAFKNIIIEDCILNNISNGGITIEGGCENILISNINVFGVSGNSTNRAIWLNGGTVSDYADQLIDIASITRNATALPTYSVNKATIKNCRIETNGEGYGIYLINTRNVTLLNNDIDISGSSLRCVAVNNYSPNCIIKNNRFTGDRASTGILVTQYSSNVLISNNSFFGDFAGGRDIRISYLSEAMVKDNYFATTTVNTIDVDMGSCGIIEDNYFDIPSFNSNYSILTHISTPSDVPTAGSTATSLKGSIFRNNVVKNRCVIVKVSHVDVSSNIPAIEPTVVTDNILYDYDQASTGSEYPLVIGDLASSNKIEYKFKNNTIFPKENATRNKVVFDNAGAGAEEVTSDIQFAVFNVSIVSGVATVTKKFGDYLGVNNVSVSSNTLNLSIRSIGANSGADVASIIGISPLSTNVASYRMTRPSTINNMIILDSTGTQINIGSVDVEFDVFATVTAT